MCGFSLDIEVDTVGSLALDLKSGGSGVVEIPVQELWSSRKMSVSDSRLRIGSDRAKLTSLEGFAMSEKGTGMPDMLTKVNMTRELEYGGLW